MPTLDPVYWISTPIFPYWGTKSKFTIPMIKYNRSKSLDWNYTRFLPDDVNYTNEKYYTPARMDNSKVNCSSDISHSLTSVPYNKWWLYPWESSHDADNYLVGGQDVQTGWDFWFQTSCSELPPDSWSADPIENVDYRENGFNKWETHWYRMSIKLGNGTFIHTEFSNDGTYIQKYSLNGVPCHGAGSIDIGSTLQYYKPYQDGMFAIVGLYKEGFDPENPDPDYIEDFAIITNVNHPSSYEWNYFRLYGWENFEFHHEDDPYEPEPTEEDMKINKPYLGSFFNRVYCCKRDHVTALAIYVCQTIPQARINDWENFLTRLNMAWGGFGEWLDSVIDVTIFPFNIPDKGVDLSAVPNNTVRFSPADVSMGTWTSANWDDVSFSATIYKINSTDCLFDATDWKLISRKFNDFRDFPPYRKSVLYIPFVGNIEFNLHNYYGKYMKIKYAVDLMNGGCRAFICIANSNSVSDDGIIVASYDGQMGVHVPVSKLEYGEYYTSITQALGNTISSSANVGANLAMSGTNIPTSIASKPIKNKILAKGAEKLNSIKSRINSSKLMTSKFGIQARRLGEGVGQGVSQGIIGGFEGSVAGAGSGSLEAFQSVFSLNRAESNVPFSTSGSSTPSLSSYSDWHCRIIWYESVTNETGNLLQMKGYPSNKSGTLQSFSGYLSVSDVKLVCPKATENEKAMIREMLTNGIYI